MTRPITNGNLPATSPSVSNSDGVFEDSDSTGLGYDLTKREAFAMAAMQGLCANQYFIADRDSSFTEIATNATLMADRLLAELDK